MLVLLAMGHDLVQRRIPNRLLLVSLCAGMFGALLPDGPGLRQALAGALVSGAAFAPLYLLRQLGAGDLKLMITAGLMVGMPRALALSLSVAMAGGLMALWWIWHARGQHRPATAPFDRMPYAVAIGLGTAAHGLLAPLLGSSGH